MARAENGYSLLVVRYSAIEGWDALPISLYCPLIVSEQGDVAQTSLLDSELPPACLVTSTSLCSCAASFLMSFVLSVNLGAW